MESQLASYILTYGYAALFICVFLQEIGIPGPPNELLLFSVGMMARHYQLGFGHVMALVVIADMASACLLYFLSYRFGYCLTTAKARWLQKPLRAIEKLKEKIARSRSNALLIGKLTPFVRGYIPVAAGLMQISPAVYLRIVLITACIWSGGWVTAGWLLCS